MKKNIFVLLLSAVVLVSLTGCDEYLNRVPLDSNSDATNWSSESAIETYSWNLYGDISGLSYGSGWTRGQYHGEALTDDYSTESFTQFTVSVPGSSGSWNTPYDNIRKANVMLSRIDQVPNLSDAAANHWRGVARFFRALHHFELLKTYGDVVWVDGEVNIGDAEALQRSRDSRVMVADNIVADLQFAMNNCYAPNKAGANTINNMVAAAFLSRVALYEAAWEKYHGTSGGHAVTFYNTAKEAANKVISSGLYNINTTYKKNYTSQNLSGNTEMILFKRYAYMGSGGAATHAHATFGWSDSSTPTWGLTKSAVENYAMSNGLPVHMVNYDDQSIAGVFENRDARLTATVYKEVIPVTQLAYIEGIVSTTGYWTYKFVPLDEYLTRTGNSTWNGPYNDTDGPIFAYPEVLLNYAEACAELGSCTQSDLDKTVNVLRQRHGNIPALTVAGTGCSVNGTAITKDPKDPAANVLIQEIRRERRSELMADGFRHADLMRWALGDNLDTAKNPDGYVGVSKAVVMEYIAKYNAENVSQVDPNKVLSNNYFTNTGYKSPYNTPACGGTIARTWNDKYYLEPIPSAQITLDPNLGQNPGW